MGRGAGCAVCGVQTRTVALPPAAGGPAPRTPPPQRQRDKQRKDHSPVAKQQQQQQGRHQHGGEEEEDDGDEIGREVCCATCVRKTIHAYKDKLARERRRLDELRELITPLLDAAHIIARQTAARTRQARRIEALRQELEAEHQRVETLRPKLWNLRFAKHDRVLELQKGRAKLLDVDADPLHAAEQDQEARCEDAHAMLAALKRERVLHLASLLPIRRVNAKTCSIVGLSLPDDGQYRGLDPAVVAAALGACVHLLSLMLRYLHIPSPFRLKHRASRSRIARHGEPDQPLFLEANSRNEDGFARGVATLNQAVVHLLGIHGTSVPPARTRCLLPNMLALLDHPRLGMDLHPPLELVPVHAPPRPRTQSSTGGGAGMDPTTLGEDEAWDVIDVPTAPRPTQLHDVEQWTRAMFVDKVANPPQ